MEISEALSHLRKNHRAVLATRRRDGDPQLSPVVEAVGEDERILISTRASAIKTRNALRNPRVSLCSFRDAFFGEWIQVDGFAEIIELPEAMQLLRFTYRQISGEHPDWVEFEQAMFDQRRVIIAITPVRAGPDVSG
ncbi:MAG TPA: PPOX class F420-dependent oxidoreductase [Acidimicrobiales bacterium]|nr:PPOX class F420-dependent oxidoreductase [Acidimicrobiales bacterium]